MSASPERFSCGYDPKRRSVGEIHSEASGSTNSPRSGILEKFRHSITRLRTIAFMPGTPSLLNPNAINLKLPFEQAPHRQGIPCRETAIVVIEIDPRPFSRRWLRFYQPS